MSPLGRLSLALGGLGAITLAGTLGYRWVEGWPWLDALYMTVITLSTVGYREAAPLSAEGKLFTVALIVVGVGVALYLVTHLAGFLLEGRVRELILRTAMQRRIDRIEDHVIVCGYGRFGRAVVEELLRGRAAVVVIEADATKQPALEAAGLPYLILSATTDEALERAGIQRAKAALKRGSDPIRIAPDKQTRVEEGDHLVVIGDREHLDQLARRAEGADA